MILTPNYNLKKIELTDSPPDITVLNPNFDVIDTKFKSLDDNAQLFKLTADSGLVHQTIPGGVTNLNSLTTPGFYNISGLAGGPKTSSYGVLEVIKRNNSVIFQKFYDSAPVSVETYERKSFDGGASWGAWDMMALMNNAMVDHGYNANGKYVKFGDGTMICYAKFSGAPNPAVSLQQIVWTFPSAFIDANVSVSGSFFCIHSGVAFRNGILLSNTSESSKTSCNFTGVDFNQGQFNSWLCDLMVIGRWK